MNRLIQHILVLAMTLAPILLYGTEEHLQPFSFATFDCTTENMNKGAGAAFSRLLGKRIGREQQFTIIDRKGMKAKGIAQTECNNNRCASESGAILPADKAIIGTVTRIEIKTKEGLARYVTEKIEKEKFAIRIKVIDVTSSRTELDIKENIKGSEYPNVAANRIAKRIIDFYTRPLPLQKEEPKVEQKEEPKVEPKVEQKERPKSSIGFKFTGASLSGSFLEPFGNYKDTADYGLGFNLRLYGTITPFERVVLFVSSDFFYLHKSDAAVQYAYMISSSFCVGYHFPLFSRFYLMPFGGFGYIFHWIKDDNDGRDESGNYDYTLSSYYNPLITIGFDAGYAVTDRWSLFITPLYGIFFEKRTVDHFISISLGAKIRF